MLFSTITSSIKELQQILKIQEENRFLKLDKSEIRSQGFVTLKHSLPVLQKMHDAAPQYNY